MQIITYTTKSWLKTPLVLWVVISTIFMLTGAYFVLNTNKADAAALTSISALLTDSAPSVDSDHTVSFTLTSGVDDIGDNDTITVEWDTVTTTDQFDFTDVVLSDVTLTASGNAQTLAANCAGADPVGAVVSVGTDQIVFTICTDALNTDFDAGSPIIVFVGTTNNIANPAKVAGTGIADVYDITISTSSDTLADDSGTAYVAVIDSVTVSVTVEESLTFSITGQNAAGCTGDTGTPAPIIRDVSAANNTVPFGTIIDTNRFYAACQELQISSNAVDGYQITAESDTSLRSGTTNIASDNCDGTCTQSTGSAWATTTNNGFAYFCEEGTNTPCADAGYTTAEYRNFACTGTDAQCDPRTGAEAPVVVMTEAGTASASTGKIHYKLNIDPAQTTGLTYQAIVTYI